MISKFPFTKYILSPDPPIMRNPPNRTVFLRSLYSSFFAAAAPPTDVLALSMSWESWVLSGARASSICFWLSLHEEQRRSCIKISSFDAQFRSSVFTLRAYL